MQETLMSLFIWLCATTGVLPIMPPPEVKFVSQKELQTMYCGDNKPCYTLKAVYLNKDKTIYLPTGFKGESKEEQSTLVHELVHHLQFVLEASPPPCFDEAEAYFIEDIWRKQNGLQLNTPTPGFQQFLGRCVLNIVAKGAR